MINVSVRPATEAAEPAPLAICAPAPGLATSLAGHPVGVVRNDHEADARPEERMSLRLLKAVLVLPGGPRQAVGGDGARQHRRPRDETRHRRRNRRSPSPAHDMSVWGHPCRRLARNRPAACWKRHRASHRCPTPGLESRLSTRLARIPTAWTEPHAHGYGTGEDGCQAGRSGWGEAARRTGTTSPLPRADPRPSRLEAQQAASTLARREDGSRWIRDQVRWPGYGSGKFRGRSHARCSPGGRVNGRGCLWWSGRSAARRR